MAAAAACLLFLVVFSCCECCYYFIFFLFCLIFFVGDVSQGMGAKANNLSQVAQPALSQQRIKSKQI